MNINMAIELVIFILGSRWALSDMRKAKEDTSLITLVMLECALTGWAFRGILENL